MAALAAWAAHPTVAVAPAWQWQRALYGAEPWRLISAAFVHYSPVHLLANAAGCAALALWAWAAQAPPRAAAAWLLAWPLTHLLLLLHPGIGFYGGLSGVLHAGVAVVCVFALAASVRRQQGQTRRSPAQERQTLIAAVVLAGLLLKVLLELPWGPAVRPLPGWGIDVVPFAHSAGVLAGLLASILCLLLPKSQPSTARA
jgi:rhomboid family GlyGly-CTERM serine protease